jgi:mycofactocin precursor peptide peptidase
VPPPGPVALAGRSPYLADLTWPEVRDQVQAGAFLAVPLGATEQHGPHLPLSTDADIAMALSQRLAAARRDVLIAPPLAYGSSGEHAGFAGTLSVGQDAVELVVLELGRSAAETFPRVLFVSAHGGNSEPVRMDRSMPGDTRPLAELMPLLRDGGVRSVSRSGILGNPAGATAAAGQALLQILAEALMSQVREWYPEAA